MVMLLKKGGVWFEDVSVELRKVQRRRDDVSVVHEWQI